MILVDSSAWIDHLRSTDRTLIRFLEMDSVLTHPFVIAELALGRLRQRDQIIGWLGNLPRAKLATNDELLHFIERQELAGIGIGFVDAHLLASVALVPDTTLWTRDRRLHTIAQKLGRGARLA